MKFVAPAYDKQWILGRVVEHFRQHPRRSYDSAKVMCLYRKGDDRCPVGAVIPDYLYRAGMEGYRVRDLLPVFVLPKWLTEHIDFLEALQTWHDKNRPFDEMMAELPAIARAHGLETVDVQAAIV